jgi:hypothetical protein
MRAISMDDLHAMPQPARGPGDAFDIWAAYSDLTSRCHEL